MLDTQVNTIKAIGALFNSGFIFADGFEEDRRFKRYRNKCSDSARAFLNVVLGADASLCDLMLSFFAFWASDKGKRQREEFSVKGRDDAAVCDWCCNLIPLAWCEPYDFENSDEAVKAGWRKFFENPDIFEEDVFDHCLSEACMQYLHDRLIDSFFDEKLDIGNFCVKAVPERANDVMHFVRLLLNLIWTFVYSVAVWTQQDRADDVLENHDLKRDNDGLREENGELRSALEKIRSETIPDLEKRLKDIGESRDGEVRKAIAEYRSKADAELRSLRHKNNDLSRSVEKLREANSSLREQLAIAEAVARDDGASRDIGLSLDHDSKILFIACRAGNGSVQGTYDRLLRRFPNSRMAYDDKDIAEGFDCYVMLTKYLFTHAAYWNARDRLVAMRVPYVHSESQNVDRIASDIFNKSRYHSS